MLAAVVVALLVAAGPCLAENTVSNEK